LVIVTRVGGLRVAFVGVVVVVGGVLAGTIAACGGRLHVFVGKGLQMVVLLVVVVLYVVLLRVLVLVLIGTRLLPLMEVLLVL
jgi:hypothetical protein